MNLPMWLRIPFAWTEVRRVGVYAYESNTITGARRAKRISYGGHSPVDRDWVETGVWSDTRRPPPPAPLRPA